MTKRRGDSMDDIARSLMNYTGSEGSGADKSFNGNSTNKCKLIMGAPKNKLNEFSAVVYFEDENGNVLLQNNEYSDTTSVKLPGGKSADELITDKLFEKAILDSLQAWSYTSRAQELALKKIKKWPADLSVAKTRILRMGMMEVIEEDGLFPDDMEIVCHTLTPNNKGEGDYVTVFIRAFRMYDRNDKSGGLSTVADLWECNSLGVRSPLSKNISDSVMPVHKDAVLEELAPKKHKMAFPHLRDFKRPEAE
ncbi:MAG: hypothetical protein ACI88L_000339 [Candidatus Paceibacteria bacterium]|jgi:hypothetical protein